MAAAAVLLKAEQGKTTALSPGTTLGRALYGHFALGQATQVVTPLLAQVDGPPSPWPPPLPVEAHLARWSDG